MRGDLVGSLAAQGVGTRGELTALYQRYFLQAHGDEDLAGLGDPMSLAQAALGGQGLDLESLLNPKPFETSGPKFPADPPASERDCRQSKNSSARSAATARRREPRRLPERARRASGLASQSGWGRKEDRQTGCEARSLCRESGADLHRPNAQACCLTLLALACSTNPPPRQDGGALEDAGAVDGGDDAGPLPDGGPDGGADAGLDDAGEDLSVWPNSQSAANSDPWIVAHHDRLREMHPKVLALNFVNGRTNADMEALIAQIFAGLKEGSRYHGYTNPNAPPFLIYELAKSVDLTDHPYPDGGPRANSSFYPRKPASSTDIYHFNYGALFDQQFADYYGFANPANPGRNLTLCELLQRGMVHESLGLTATGTAPITPTPPRCSR